MIAILFAIISKNFKILISNKLSSSVILLGPLLLFALVGIAFSNQNLTGLKLSVYSDSYNNVTNKLMEQLDSAQVKVLKSDTNQSCVDSVVKGNSHICLVFPKNFDLQNKVTFYVDFSRMNLVWTLVNIMTEKISSVSTDLGIQSAQSLISKLYESSSALKSGGQHLKNITASAQGIGKTLGKVEMQIKTTSLSPPNFSQGELDNEIMNAKSAAIRQNNEFRSQISSTESSLNSFDARIADTDQKFAKRKAEDEESRKQLQQLFGEIGCAAEESVNLEPFKDDSEKMLELLQSNPRPDCTLVYSYTQLLTHSIEETEKAQKDLQLVKGDVSAAKQQLQTAKQNSKTAQISLDETFNSFQSRADELNSALAGVEKQTEEFQEQQQSLGEEMQKIRKALEATSGTIMQLSSRFENISSDFNTLALLDPRMVVMPLQSEVKPVEKLRDVSDYLFPSLLVLIITFVGILLAATVAMQERNSSAFFRNAISPVPDSLFVLGTYLTVLIVLSSQISVLFLFAQVFFDITIPISQLFSFALAVLVISTIFILIGMLLAYMLKSIEITIILAISVACILFTFSSVIIPFEKMTPIFRLLASFNPFLLSEHMFRRVILFHEGFLSMLPYALKLLAEITILAIATYVAFIRMKATK